MYDEPPEDAQAGEVGDASDDGTRYSSEDTASSDPTTGHSGDADRRRLLADLSRRDGGRCGLCAGKIDLNAARIYHVVPMAFAVFDVSKRGKARRGDRYTSRLHEIYNLQATHAKCYKRHGNSRRVGKWRHQDLPPLPVAYARGGSLMLPRKPLGLNWLEPDATGRWDPNERGRMIDYVHRRDGFRCGLCAGDMTLKGAHLEHIVPKVFAVFDVGADGRARRGTRFKSRLHRPDNLQAAHTYCNKQKGNTQKVDEWRHPVMPQLAVADTGDGKSLVLPCPPPPGPGGDVRGLS